MMSTGQPSRLARASAGVAVIATLLLLTTRLPGQPAPPGPEPVSPLPPVKIADPAKVALGEALFHDRRLSRGDVLACVSCHRLDQGGDDGRMHANGLDGSPLDFNAPTIFNAALSFRLNWRGNFRTLEEQNEAVLFDPRLMGTTWDEVVRKLRADPGHERAFAAVYGAPPGRPTVLDALAAFQRSLLTPNARFDRHLRGEHGAISADEERGYHLFKAYGCVACHQGTNIGGNLFQQFGIFAQPLHDPMRRTESDLGRITVTGKESDRNVFRVPSLRNVALTAPYFHDGRTASLQEAVAVMAYSQLGRELPDEDLRLIVKFLGTLTGEYRGRLLHDDGHNPP